MFVWLIETMGLLSILRRNDRCCIIYHFSGLCWRLISASSTNLLTMKDCDGRTPVDLAKHARYVPHPKMLYNVNYLVSQTARQKLIIYFVINGIHEGEELCNCG